MQPKTFWVIVLGSLLTVAYYGQLCMSVTTATLVAVAVCGHLYFLGELERQGESCL